MKKIITLKTEYLNAKKLKKVDEAKAREKLFNDSVSLFKKQMKPFFDTKGIRIIQEDWERNEIVIEFEKTNQEIIHADLVKSDIVEVIDSTGCKE